MVTSGRRENTGRRAGEGWAVNVVVKAFGRAVGDRPRYLYDFEEGVWGGVHVVGNFSAKGRTAGV
jgi:hypothetical protein